MRTDDQVRADILLWRSEKEELEALRQRRIAEVMKEPEMAAASQRIAVLKRRISSLTEESMQILRATRIKNGLCQHCGGPTPCGSEWGDSRPGKRHTTQTLKAMRRQRDAIA